MLADRSQFFYSALNQNEEIMTSNSANKEAFYILVSIILGLIVGFALYYSGNQEMANYIKPIGDAFLKLLKMIIVPLVLASIFMAIINIGSPDELGSMGIRAMAYYFTTTAIAVFIGIIMVNLIQPGVGVDISSITSELSAAQTEKFESSGSKGLGSTIIGVLLDAIPTNPFKAMADMKILQIIVFSLFLGVVSLMNKKVAMPLINFMESLEKVSMVMIDVIMKIAPFGIFALMVYVIANSGFSAIYGLSKYMSAVILGLFFHFIVLVLIAAWRHKSSPFFIIKSCLPPMLTAFSTSSSASTLPVTMNAVQDNLGVNKKTAQFVLPLGATINMDGTALYESVAVIFIGQAYGLDLSIANQIIIFITASLAAVGAAAIPGAGLVTMSIVLSAVGYPLEGIALILAVDRILDMFRTMINVFGDCVGTVVVDSFDKKTT